MRKQKFETVTMDQVCKILSSLEPNKYILFVEPTSSSRLQDYLADKLGFENRWDVDGALFFQAKFSGLEEAKEFAAEYLADDGHWQELALAIFYNGCPLWEGMKK